MMLLRCGLALALALAGAAGCVAGAPQRAADHDTRPRSFGGRPGWLIARSADIRVSDKPYGHASGGCEAGWHGKQLMQQGWRGLGMKQ